MRQPREGKTLTESEIIDARRLIVRFRLAVLVCGCLSVLTLVNAFGSTAARATASDIAASGDEFFGVFLLGWAAFSGILVIPFIVDAFSRLIQRGPIPPEDGVFVAQLFDYTLWQLPSFLGFVGMRMGGTLLFALATSAVTVIGSGLWFPRHSAWAAWLGVAQFPVDVDAGPREKNTERLTLWEAVERHRGRRALVMASFIGVWSGGVGAILWAAVACPLLLGNPALAARIASAIPTLPPGVSTFVLSLCAGFVTGCVYAVWAVRQPEWRFVQRLGARHVRAAELPVTFEALRQMSIAAGIQHVPALHVFDAEAGINAMVVGRRPETCVVAVSRGLTSEPLATQRVVFASLLSRFQDGGLSWTTILAYLIWPLTGTRRAALRAYDGVVRKSAKAFGTDDVRSALAGLSAAIMFISVLIALTVWISMEGSVTIPVSVVVVFGLVASGCLAATFVGFVLVAMFRGSHRTMVRSADVEGLLLLRDPQEFSQALRDVILADNNLPYLKDLGFLAFTNDDGTCDELADRLEALDSCCWEPV